MTLQTEQRKIMTEIVQSIDEVIGKINLFVPNRHGSIAITRLEEAVMWTNVMIASYPMVEADKIPDQSVEKNEELACAV